MMSRISRRVETCQELHRLGASPPAGRVVKRQNLKKARRVETSIEDAGVSVNESVAAPESQEGLKPNSVQPISILLITHQNLKKG